MTNPDPRNQTAPFTPTGDTAPRQPAAPSARRVFWLRGPGIIVLIVAGGLVLFGILALTGSFNATPAKAKNFSVNVTDCSVTGRTATIGVSVKNNGDTTRGATVAVEYRDGDGARLDTDTVYVRSIAPGDTARSDESTFLDAEAASVRCVVTGIR